VGLEPDDARDPIYLISAARRVAARARGNEVLRRKIERSHLVLQLCRLDRMQVLNSHSEEVRHEDSHCSYIS